MKKVLVTGATGLIGSSLLEVLTRGNFKITAFTRTMSADIISRAKTEENVLWMQGDLNSLADCKEIVYNQDIIFHLAHKNAPLTCDLDWPADARLNLIPTLNLIQAVQESGNKPHIIYPSSGGAVYGPVKEKIPILESHACNPENSYGIQKFMAEHYLRVAAQRGFLTASVLRIANVYGWLVSPSRKQGFIGTALYQTLAGQPLRIIGNPGNIRDYVHMDDVNKAFLLCVKPSLDFDIINIGTGQGTSVSLVVQILEKILNKDLDKKLENSIEAKRLSDWCVLNIEKAWTDLGWKPEIDIESGIRKMILKVK